MGRYSVPAEIRALRPVGTQVKRQGDLFYVYETSSTKKKMHLDDGTYVWKTVTKSGKCIGRITLKDGFIPNMNRLTDDAITVLGYGNYAFALKSTETLSALNATFHPKDAAQIYVAAVITVVDGFTYMKDMADVYNESFLCLMYPEVHVGATALRTLYENLGKRTARPTLFQQSLIDTSSGKIAFDGHVIACTSEKNDLSEYGYKVTIQPGYQPNIVLRIPKHTIFGTNILVIFLFCSFLDGAGCLEPQYIVFESSKIATESG